MSEEHRTIQLVAEFKRITENYEQALAELPRRAEILYELIQSDGMTYRQVGLLLGISAGRVGQIVKGASTYVPARHSAA